MIERDRDADGNPGNGLEERLYVQQDANWNVTAVLNTSGSVQERYIEDPYGQASMLAPDWSSRGSSSFVWNYLHQGGRYDSTSGLYNFRNRDYSPTLGRWVSTDPIAFAGGDTNLYRYSGNRPPAGTDPSGLQMVVREGPYNGWTVYYGDGYFYYVPPNYVELPKKFPDPIGWLRNPSPPPSGSPDGISPAWGSTWEYGGSQEFYLWVWRDMGPLNFVIPKGAPPALQFGPSPYPRGLPGNFNSGMGRINRGIPFQHNNDGTVFKNYPDRTTGRQPLPPNADGDYYREYVLPTPGVSGPGALRIVIGKNGDVYYTPDHYKTFTPVPTCPGQGP
jgi:RHS repeat-associated protein